MRCGRAQQRDADEETHQSAAALGDAEAEFGLASQEADAATAALADDITNPDSMEELVAAARDAVTELAEQQDVAEAPVTDSAVVEDSAVADDIAPVSEMR